MQVMGRTTVKGDERLTTVGLLVESAAGLRREFQHRFESERAFSNQSFDVLIRLARTPGAELRMSELAAQTSLTPSGLTRSIDRLCDQGLVVRRVCSEDRRGAFAVLTPVGKDLMAKIIPEHIAHIDNLLSSLYTPEEEETLAALLRRLRDHLFATNSDCDLTPDAASPCPESA